MMSFAEPSLLLLFSSNCFFCIILSWFFMNLAPLLCKELALIKFSFSYFCCGVRPICVCWCDEPLAVLIVGPWVLERIEAAAETLLLV